MRTLGIDPGSLKVKLPGLEGEGEEGEDRQDGVESANADDAGMPSADEIPQPYQTSDWAGEPDTGASTLDWNIQAARMDWADTPGGTAGGSTFGNLFNDYSVNSSSQTENYGWNSSQRQGIDLFQMPMITGISIFDCLAQPC
jgi:hypothetical protein